MSGSTCELSVHITWRFNGMLEDRRRCTIDTVTAAHAYDSWRAARRRKHHDAARAFASQIQSRVLHRSKISLDIPTSRQTWSDWRNDKLTSAKTLTYVVCLAIFEETGHDITIEKHFQKKAQNKTQAVHLDSLVTKLVSNEPVDDIERYEISISNLFFRFSESIGVTTEMAGAKTSTTYSLGKAKVALREAHIILEAAGSVAEQTQMIVPRDDDTAGEVKGFFLQESPNSGCQWIVQPIDAGYLIGQAKDLRMAYVDCVKGQSVSLSIGAYFRDLDVKFYPDFDNELEPKQQRHARNRIIAKFIHDQLRGSDEMLELSFSKVKL